MGVDSDIGVEHLKRLACQIVAQLPESEAEAYAVLQYAESIIEKLRSEPVRTANVVPISRPVLVPPIGRPTVS